MSNRKKQNNGKRFEDPEEPESKGTPKQSGGAADYGNEPSSGSDDPGGSSSGEKRQPESEKPKTSGNAKKSENFSEVQSQTPVRYETSKLVPFEEGRLGHTIPSWAAWLKSFYMGSLREEMISVPASFTGKLVMFNFHTIVEETDTTKGVTREAIDSLIRLVLRQFEAFQSGDFDAILESSGLSEITFGSVGTRKFVPGADTEIVESKESKKIVAQKLLEILHNEALTTQIRGSILPMFMKTVLEEGLLADSIDELKDLSGNAILEIITIFQEVYRNTLNMTSTEEMAAYMNKTIANNPCLKFVHTLSFALKNHGSPLIPTRMSYVLNDISKNIWGEPFMKETPVIENIHYTLFCPLTDESGFELTYEGALTTAMRMLRLVMGYSDVDPSTDVSLSDLLTASVSASPVFAPVLPKGLTSEANPEEVIKELVPRLWMIFLLKRLKDNVPPMSGTRIKSLLDRRYKSGIPLDAFSAQVEVIALAYEAALDVNAFLFQFSDRRDVYFGVHPKERADIEKIVNLFLDPFRVTNVPLDNPRFINNADQVLSRRIPVGLSEIHNVYESDQMDSERSILSNMETLERIDLRRGRFIKGNPWNIKLPFHPSLFNYMEETIPHRAIVAPGSNLTTEFNAFKVVTHFMKLDKFLKKTKFAKTLLSYVAFHHIITVKELEMVTGVSSDIAKKIWSQNDGAGTYISFGILDSILFTWEDNHGPVYNEFILSDDIIHYEMLVTSDPFVMKRTISLGDASFAKSDPRPGVSFGNRVIAKDDDSSVVISPSDPQVRKTDIYGVGGHALSDPSPDGLSAPKDKTEIKKMY